MRLSRFIITLLCIPNWVTPKSYANSCKTLQLNLGDGLPRTAAFQFTK